MVDHGRDTPVESFVVHSPNVGARRMQLRRKTSSVLVDTIFCTCQNDQSGLIGRRRVTVYADSRENQLVKMVADEWW